MRWSAEKFRWVLVGGTLLLAAVLAALFGLANYRAGKIWQRILARNGVNLRRETNGITWSQSKGGRTIFTLHASKATPRGDGKWALHDAVLILYGRQPGHADRIYGSEFEYDEKAGVARANGEVNMDLQPPQSAASPRNDQRSPDLTFVPEDRAAGDPTILHVRTSGLIFTRKLNLAATDQPAEFRYKGLRCTSRGAEFDSDASTVRLLADVQLQGTLRQQPFALRAASATFNQSTNIADLSAPELHTADRDARAAHAVLHLRKDGSVESGNAEGGVRLGEATRTITAPQLAGVFDEQSRPQHARFTGGVAFADSNKARPTQGSAQQVELAFSPAGQVQTMTARGAVTGMAKQMGANGVVLGTRRLRGNVAVANFAAHGKKATLQRLQLTGAAAFASEAAPRAAGEKPVYGELDGDELTTTFTSQDGRNAEPEHLSGKGHTTLQRTGAKGQRQESTGDALEASFAEEKRPAGATGLERVGVSSAVQTGHVALRAWDVGGGVAGSGSAKPVERTGRADTATYDALADTLALAANGGGRAEVSDGQSELLAGQILLHQDSGDSEAAGDVALSVVDAKGGPASHVLATRARLHHATDVSEFFGTETRPAQLFQGGSQVQAALITVDGHQHTLSARPGSAAGQVHAVFAAERKSAASGNPAGAAKVKPKLTGSVGGDKVSEADREAVRIAAARMDFNDLQHEATFGGGVRMQGAAGEVTSDRGVAFLKGTAVSGAPAASGKPVATPLAAGVPLGGTLDRLVMLGDVHIRQTGRSGTGEQLTYVAGTNSFVLTGTPAAPPRMTDSQGGLVTGATLLFGASDSSIVVAGANGKASGPARVHTETDLKGQSPQ